MRDISLLRRLLARCSEPRLTRELRWLKEAHALAGRSIIRNNEGAMNGSIPSLDEQVDLLVNHEAPLSFLIGRQEFMGSQVYVRQGILCPRDTTEVISAWTAAMYDVTSNPATRHSLSPYVPSGVTIEATSESLDPANVAPLDGHAALALRQRLCSPLLPPPLGLQSVPSTQPPTTIVDLGCGSGCFGGSLAQLFGAVPPRPQPRVGAHLTATPPTQPPNRLIYIDIDADACELALRNAQLVWGAVPYGPLHASVGTFVARPALRPLYSPPAGPAVATAGPSDGSCPSGAASAPAVGARGRPAPASVTATADPLGAVPLEARWLVSTFHTPLQAHVGWASAMRTAPLESPAAAVGGRAEGRARRTIVVSNPPYIPTPLMHACDPDVLRYEAHTALDGGPTGLAVVADVIAACAAHLPPLAMDHHAPPSFTAHGAPRWPRDGVGTTEGAAMALPPRRHPTAAAQTYGPPNVVIEMDIRCCPRDVACTVDEAGSGRWKWFAVLHDASSSAAWVCGRM